MSDPALILGQNIRRHRRVKDLEQATLAEVARISVPYLSDLERGKREPSVFIVARIATALGTTVDALLTHSGEQTGACSRCRQPIRDFAPPSEGVTAGYYLASAFPQYANEGEVYICDACMWRDVRYVRDHGVPLASAAAAISSTPEPTTDAR